MMVIWQGRGHWALWIPMLTIAGPAFGLDYLADRGGEVWATSHGLSMGLAAAGVICLLMGLYYRRVPGTLAIERETGRQITFRPVHSLYFIRIEYWGLAWLIGGGWLFFIGL